MLVKGWPSGAALAACLIAPSLQAQVVLAPTRERCEPARTASTAEALLARAAAAVLPDAETQRILRFRASFDTPLWEQSDRMYEPFIPNTLLQQTWYDPATGISARQPIDRPAPAGRFPAQLLSATEMFMARDTMLVTLPAVIAATRPSAAFNPWVVLREWRADGARVRVARRCYYRDAWRTVLARGTERLYLSESDAVPVKLERLEAHYLWGQVTSEYLWSTWWGVVGGSGLYPNAAFRIVDGTVYERVGVSQFRAELVSRDSAPRMDVTNAMPPLSPSPTQPPDTVRVGPSTFLLVDRAYTHAVSLQRDTLFLFDATSGDERARHDLNWISRLFPGRHPIVLVVSDLAWPHISGIRFWVGKGASIVSHATSEPFLRRVVEREWTLAPDSLEGTKASRRFRFRGVTDSLRLAGGSVVVHALRNTSTENAVGAWVRDDRFFWAGDYVQGDARSPYARDVVLTIRVLGLEPLKVGAQHVPQSDWHALDARFVRWVDTLRTKTP